MADKDFKVKNKLFVNGLSNASGVILATNNNLDSSTTLPTQYGGTGTTTSPNAGQIPYSSSGTNYAPTDLSSLTISSSGGSTITAASASTKGLTIQGAASQTANLQEWQDSSGNVLVRILSSGHLNTNAPVNVNGFPAGYTFFGVKGNDGTVPISIIRGSTSQTADLQQWQNSAGTVLSSINSSGNLILGNQYISNSGASAYGRLQLLDGATNQTIMYPSSSGLLIANAGVTGMSVVKVRGASGQTANLQEWQNSAGTVLTSVNSFGDMTAPGVFSSGSIRGGTTSSLGGFHSYTSNIPSIPVVVNRAASSQTANIEEWQNNSGTVLSSITSSGDLNFGTNLWNIKSSGTNVIQWQPTLGSTFLSYGSSNPPITIQGSSGQTANLTNWQNSSGTVLASISAAGNLTVQDLTVNGTTTTINSTTLTVDDKNIELASVASPTDTTADGAGITIKGATDKTFNWVQSTGAFTSSEPISTPALSVSGNSVSSNITLAAGKRYFVDTTSARTLTLPASPTLADTIEIYDASGAAATNNITVNSNSGKINGTVQDLTVDTNGAAFSLVYTGSTYGWVVR